MKNRDSGNITFLYRIAFWLAFTGLPLQVFSQIEQSDHFEIDFKWKDENYVVISNEEQGVTLIQTDISALSKEYPVMIKHLNKELELVWSDTFKIERKFSFRGYHYLKNSTYLLFQNSQLLNKVRLFQLDHGKQEIKDFEVTEIVDLEVQEFEVIQNTAIVGGYYEERPVVFAYDMEKEALKTLAGVYQNDSELLEVKVNKDSVTFNVLASKLDEKKDRTIIVNTYDYEGNLVRDYTLNTSIDYDLIGAVSSSINDISQVIVGHYGYKSSSIPSGIFVNYVNRTGEQTMTYHNYGLLPSFFDFMGDKRANKLRSKASAYQDNQKEYRFRTQPVMREMVEEGDYLVLFEEHFKPVKEPDSYTDLQRRNFNRINYYNRYNYLTPYPGALTSNPFYIPPNDFDFTHAYTLVLDQQGKIQWDGYMEIDDELEGSLDEFGKFQWAGDHAVYMLYHEEKLRAKWLDAQKEAQEITDEITPPNENEEIRSEQKGSSGILKWYDQYFLVYGVHQVKPVDEKSRKVFFLNKVSLERPGGTDTAVD